MSVFWRTCLTLVSEDELVWALSIKAANAHRILRDRTSWEWCAKWRSIIEKSWEAKHKKYTRIFICFCVLFFPYMISKLVYYGYHSEVPHIWRLKQQRYFFSWFWRLEVQYQGVGRVGFFWESFLWLLNGHHPFLCVCLHMVFCVCLCLHLLF